eukprot:NODE_258_length_11607_cov_1.052659.p8 type:complete len:104 gc:universal NODE_258_length_11607_cov_1.052659:3134-2823(-)
MWLDDLAVTFKLCAVANPFTMEERYMQAQIISDICKASSELYGRALIDTTTPWKLSKTRKEEIKVIIRDLQIKVQRYKFRKPRAKCLVEENIKFAQNNIRKFF